LVVIEFVAIGGAVPWRWGSSGSGISSLLPDDVPPLKSGRRIGYMGEFTESCCHGSSKLQQAVSEETLRVGERWPGQHHLARPTDYDELRLLSLGGETVISEKTSGAGQEQERWEATEGTEAFGRQKIVSRSESIAVFFDGRCEGPGQCRREPGPNVLAPGRRSGDVTLPPQHRGLRVDSINRKPLFVIGLKSPLPTASGKPAPPRACPETDAPDHRSRPSHPPRSWPMRASASRPPARPCHGLCLWPS